MFTELEIIYLLNLLESVADDKCEMFLPASKTSQINKSICSKLKGLQERLEREEEKRHEYK